MERWVARRVYGDDYFSRGRIIVVEHSPPGRASPMHSGPPDQTAEGSGSTSLVSSY